MISFNPKILKAYAGNTINCGMYKNYRLGYTLNNKSHGRGGVSMLKGKHTQDRCATIKS